MQKFETLYKKTSTGATQIWYQEISDDGTSFRTVSGQIDGKKVESSFSKCEPKNIGKANATTAEQQCLLEVQANYKKKLAQGNYKNSLDEEALDKDNFFKPMLAKEYVEDYKYTEGDDVYSEPKYDGCLDYNSLIETDMGLIKIGEIVENNLKCNVASYNEANSKIEFKPISNYMSYDNEPDTQWYEITLENGISTLITGNHSIYLPKFKCWRRVDELTTEDFVLINF